MSFPFPEDASTTHKPAKKPNVASPPGAEPPADAEEYGGLPSIYFTMRPNTSGTKPAQTTTEGYEANELSPPQKAQVNIQNTTVESTTTASGYEGTTNGKTTLFIATTFLQPQQTQQVARSPTRMPTRLLLAPTGQ
jgi:hypothetical protein